MCANYVCLRRLCSQSTSDTSHSLMTISQVREERENQGGNDVCMSVQLVLVRVTWEVGNR